ncbi:MAG TPA: hypothetical protein VF546_17525 [Pyrinomonadaceae bacterium]|jgi:hypothetical protein
MAKELLRPVFAAHEGTKFQAQLEEDARLELELIKVREIESPPTQEQFSLIFRGPLERWLEQRTYVLEHEQLGESRMMLVPIGRDETGFIYEAFFNRLLT